MRSALAIGWLTLVLAFFRVAPAAANSGTEAQVPDLHDLNRAPSDAANPDTSPAPTAPADRDTARAAIARAKADGADPRELSNLYFKSAVLDEDAGDFSVALTEYQTSVDLAPAARWARGARSRIAWLRERSEGDFAPLARLQGLWHDGARRNDPEALDALGRDAESFPAGKVRTEARMMVAESWSRRPPRRRDGFAELGRVVADPSSDAANVALAVSDEVNGLLEDGDVSAASEEVHRHPFDPKLVATVERATRRRFLRRLSTAVLAFSAVCLLGLSFAAIRRRVRDRVQKGVNSSAAVAVFCVSALATTYLLLEAFAPARLVALGL